MRTRHFILSISILSFLMSGCSNNSGQETIDVYNQEMLNLIDSIANSFDEDASRRDIDSMLLDEYVVKETSLLVGIKAYIPKMKKVRDVEGSFPGVAVNLYSFGYDKESDVFHLCIDASYLYSLVEKYPPVGIIEIDGEHILIDEFLNLSFEPSFFEKTGRQIWLKNISKTDIELEDDRFPVWNYCYDFKSKTGIYYYSGNDCVLTP